MSSKKQFDHIEDKIKQAAENYQPGFDEVAWEAMEAKLDKDKKKSRPFLWWFVLPLLVAGSWGIYYKLSNAENTKGKAISEKNDAGIISKSENKNAGEENTNALIAVKSTSTEAIGAGGENKKRSNKDEKEARADAAIKKDNKMAITGNSNTQPLITNVVSPSFTLAKSNKISYRKKGKVTVNNSGNAASTMEDDKTAGEDKDAATTSGDDKNILVKNEDAVIKSEAPVTEEKNNVAESDNKESEKQPVKPNNNEKEEKPVTPKKEEEKIQKSKGFYVLASGGIDAGSVKLFSCQNSKATSKYGLSVGYQFNKRLSVQTGLYSNMKKYAASPKYYNIKPNSPMADYPYPIDGIRATCLIYEIPLAVKYDFISKPSIILFATAGASSYIMQNERYDCFYTYYGSLYENAWYYKGNKHLFSTAVFSIGIEKKLFSRFSLLAEPSISIPVTGVGDGSMKIYSYAAQLGLKYYLFKKH